MSLISIALSPSLFFTSTVTKSADSPSTAQVVTANTSTDTTSSVNATVSTKWGFKVDENGFFTAELNKTAGIPANVKIHQNQLVMAEAYTRKIGSNDDPVTALGQVWSFFSKVAGNSLDLDGSMTVEQITKMPLSFQSNGSLLENPVSVQKTKKEMDEVSETSGKIRGLTLTKPATPANEWDSDAFDTGHRPFFGGGGYAGSLPDYQSAMKDWYEVFVAPVNPSSSIENEISVSQLFGVFSMQEMEGGIDTHESVEKYYEFLKSGQDFQSYLTDTFGADYVKNFADGMNKHFKNPDMFESLMREIDRHMKDDYASYLSSQNTTTDSFLKNNDTTAKSASSSTYQTTKNIKVPTSGSLLSVGA